MAWAEKPLKRNAFNEIVPQYYDEALDDWVPYTGVYGEVTLSGTNVLIASGANFEFEVAPGSASPTHSVTYDYKNFTWLYVRVLAQNEHDFEVEQDVIGYTRLKIANKTSFPILLLSDPFRPMGTRGRIWIKNKSLNPQKYNFEIFGMTG